jgi:hypothetical protein
MARLTAADLKDNPAFDPQTGELVLDRGHSDPVFERSTVKPQTRRQERPLGRRERRVPARRESQATGATRTG